MNLRKKTLAILRFIEWNLLIVLTGFALLITLPFLDIFSVDKDLRQAKREGVYYDADTRFQPYYDITVRVDGVVYDQQEMRVYMTGRGKQWGPYNKLPNRILVTTDTGDTYESMGSGRTTNIFRASGFYQFSKMPPGIKSITVHYEAYDESFSFDIPLQGGDPS